MPKILFVEDDQFIAEIYKKKFDISGLEAINVGTGKAVLRAVKEDSFDLILLDLVIPEMSGKEVLKELRTNDEYDKGLKIVVFSNLSSTEDRDECLQLGADGFISKTEYTPSEVIDEIQRFLRQFGERERNGSRGKTSETNSVEPVERKKILFIEDEAVFIEMFGKRLRDEGYDVIVKNEGSSGLEAALAGGFDMLITDFMMPGVGGDEIISRLRQSEHGKSVPIVLLSASVDDGQLDDVTERDSVDRVFLKTRITPSELAHAVNDLFSK
ncbi:MAG: response regulator [Candidatus Moranbacteria bacterium]|nr:response regulator [Candidatus Moranbacteria bacterium]